ncbi:CocE/NonD family hydrolase [Cognatilysobacter segetis]|uniref:CocE/NonD family hydrolase n=1 Tax=Cognatilysobacter segetis TaxID=2492394 RepID=UPI0010601DB3|nr:CocE/NonD family hydrolase [Lysobacter segetis]
MPQPHVRLAVALLPLALALAAHAGPGAKYPAYPSETPATFKSVVERNEFERREVMIAMRDGVRLHTVILVPKGARRAGILLTRTPYDADALTTHRQSPRLGPSLQGYDNATDVIVEEGYIRVVQDVRGKFGSEGDYVMNRPLHGPQNPTRVDDATDTWDTIDWLVKHVPESNGKVGTIGISYDGFEPLMSLVDPHPALKVAVPMNPMVDGWMGDDWFHHGAFRQEMIPYIYEQEASRKNEHKFASGYRDNYDFFLRYGSAGALGNAFGMQQLGFWRKLLAHPAYDAFWSDQAVDRVLADRPLKVPTLLVHSLWDQEDIYGAPAVWRALRDKDPGGTMLHMVMGPWHHGQSIGEGSRLGAIAFGSDTSKYSRQTLLKPFLAQYLKDDAPAANLPPVIAYQTGTDRWQSLQGWPVACAQGCASGERALYLQPGHRLGFEAPASGDAFDEYVSDPAHPVPYRARPNLSSDEDHDGWKTWLVSDQREAASRPDVLTYVTDPLTAPLAIAGAPRVNLVASTSGTDSDWVVKLIDVYPDEVADRPELGGYQLPVSMDIMRGRYRESWSQPKALDASKPLVYRFDLPNANHVFLPGHRVMVQVQSSWFPLYDRNPQTFVDNIMLASPAAYRPATQRVYHAGTDASFIALPVVDAGATASR